MLQAVIEPPVRILKKCTKGENLTGLAVTTNYNVYMAGVEHPFRIEEINPYKEKIIKPNQ